LFICIFLTVLFVSISQVIGCEDCLRNDLYCVEWGVKLYSNQPAYHIVHIPAKGEGACRLRLEVAYGMPNARPSGAHGRQQADRHSDRHTHRQTQTLRQDNGAVAIGRIWLLLRRCLTREKSKNKLCLRKRLGLAKLLFSYVRRVHSRAPIAIPLSVYCDRYF